MKGITVGCIVVMGLSSCIVPAYAETAHPSDKTLVDLAKEEFGTLSRGEEAFFLAIDTGMRVIFVSHDSNSVDFSTAKNWAPNRAIRADCIAWVCSNGAVAQRVMKLGISITGGRIDGVLDLRSLRISFPLVFENRHLADGILLTRTSVPLVSLSHSYCRTIQARDSELGDLFVRGGCDIPDGLDARAATIRGVMDLSRTCFGSAPGTAAVDLQRITIGERLILSGIAIDRGGIDVVEARISGDVWIDHARIRRDDGPALNAGGMEARHISLQNLETDGSVVLVDAVIDGRLLIAGARLNDPNGIALSACGLRVNGNVVGGQNLVVAGTIDLHNGNIGGTVNLRGATIKGKNGWALNASAIEAGSMLLAEIDCSGGINLEYATVAGQVDLMGAKVTEYNGIALSLGGADIKKDIYLGKGFAALGETCLGDLTVGGNLICDGGTFSTPRGRSILAPRLEVGGVVSMGDGFVSEGEIEMQLAVVGGDLILDGAKLDATQPDGVAFTAQRMEITGSAYFRGGSSSGKIDMRLATVGGDLLLDGTSLNAGREDDFAFTAEQIRVNGSAFFRNGFSASGRVNLRGASITGNLEYCGAKLVATGDRTLDLGDTTIDGQLMLSKGFTAVGMVCLNGAYIGRDLVCTDGRFTPTTGPAIYAHGAHICGNVLFCDNFHASGLVLMERTSIEGVFAWKGVASPEDVVLSLMYANVHVIQDDPNSWPPQGGLQLEGLKYDRIEPLTEASVSQRLDWLSRQPKTREWPQSYEMLARCFSECGYGRQARAVLIQKNRDTGRYSWGARWIWYRVLGPMVGFGYEPYRVLWTGFFGIPLMGSMIFWIGLGWILFGRGHRHGKMVLIGEGAAQPRQTKKPSRNYAAFNGLIYSIEAFIPLLNLRMLCYWHPNPGFLRGYLWLHIAVGWLLTTLCVAGIAGVVKT